MWQRCFWLIVVLALGHWAQGQTVFRHVFGDSLCYDEGYSVIPYADGYLVSTTQQCGSTRQAYLLFLDENGDSIDRIMPTGFNGYIRTISDGYIFLGGNKAGLAYDTIVIAKVTPLLDTLWTRRIFFPECNNQIYDLIEVADGYVATGIFSETPCSTGTSYQSFAVKLDFSGSIVWQKTYGTVGEDDEVFTVREKANGQLWYYGWKRDGNGEFPWLLATDANGDSLTSYGSNTLGDGLGYGFDLTTDGGFITIGYSDSIYARKFDSNIVMEWERGLGIQSGGIYFRAFQMQDLNYGFLACVDGPTGCNSHLFKLKPDGEMVWAKNWNGLLRNVSEPEPGQFLLTGYTNAFPVLPEALVVRFDTIFDSIPDFVGTIDGIEVILYPNPAQNILTLQASMPFNQVSIFSMDGKRCLVQHFSPSLQLTVPLQGLSQGMYVVRLQTATGQAVFKKLLVRP